MTGSTLGGNKVQHYTCIINNKQDTNEFHTEKNSEFNHELTKQLTQTHNSNPILAMVGNSEAQVIKLKWHIVC